MQGDTDMIDRPAMPTLLLPILPPQEGVLLPSGGWLAGFGTLAGLGALAASSCCALPVALAGLGASGAVFGGLGLLSDLRPILLGGAGLALLAGWVLFFRKLACGAAGPCIKPHPSWRTAAVLGLGTTLVALATVWEPYVDPIILRAMR